MPIVFVHGVATRSSQPDPAVLTLMRRYLSDVISPGHAVAIEYAYWGDLGAAPAWGGASRPRTPLLGQGGAVEADDADRALLAAGMPGVLRGLPESPSAPTGGGLSTGRTFGAGGGPTVRLSALPPERLSDLLAVIVNEGAIGNVGVQPTRRSQLLIAADEAAHDPEVAARLAQVGPAAQVDLLVAEIEARVQAGPLVGQGAGSWFGDRIREALGRGAELPGFVASRVIAEFRPSINELATLFVGDVLAYVLRRGDADHVGPIPLRFLEALHRARAAAPPAEPLVVVSHSMGGQIVYDAVTTFLPRLSADHDLRIDYWCATASQVGLFEELNMFLQSADCAPAKAPFPDRARLGGWWNVWDHNDFISYTAAPIFDGVDDEAYDTGMTLAGAHSGYLVRPSFYRRFAEKLQAAKAAGWHR